MGQLIQAGRPERSEYVPRGHKREAFIPNVSQKEPSGAGVHAEARAKLKDPAVHPRAALDPRGQ